MSTLGHQIDSPEAKTVYFKMNAFLSGRRRSVGVQYSSSSVQRERPESPREEQWHYSSQLGYGYRISEKGLGVHVKKIKLKKYDFTLSKDISGTGK